MKKSRIIQGLMRIASLSEEQLYDLIEFDLSQGIEVFDIADCYDATFAESKLGRVLSSHPGLREKMYIQSKCSIVLSEEGNYYDLSYEHIMEAVDAILNRLQTDYLDGLLLHRPDIFLDAEEIGRAFDSLKQSGKVRHLGVSNFSKEMIEYLGRDDIEVNQIQLGLGHMKVVEEAFNFNMGNEEGISRTEDTFFYLKRKGIAIQAWSPYLVGFFKGSLFDEAAYPQMNQALSALAQKYHVSKCAIATAFLLSLTKDLGVVNGSLSKEHLLEALQGESIQLAKSDWYALYKSAGKMLP